MSPTMEAAAHTQDILRPSIEPRLPPARAAVRLVVRQAPALCLDDPLQWRRRVVNVLIAALLLVATMPLMLAIALVIRLTSRGPVIYRQTRVGIDRRRPGSADALGRRAVDYGGKLFTIYKFRTMKADPESKLQIWAQPNDKRVTRVGRVLRKYRLDELPQLVNVIRGDMNLVGPRPEQPRIFQTLREAIERYPERQRVLPGITGWAQVNHHYDNSMEDVRRKLWYDLDYIHRQSVARDLLILLRTVPVVVFRRGAW